MDKLEVFGANHTSLCLDPHLSLGLGWHALKRV